MFAGAVGPPRAEGYISRATVSARSHFTWRLQRGCLLFASELKAPGADPGFAQIDRDALALYLRHGYVPDPHCIYRSAMKLPAGTSLSLGGERSERIRHRS